MSSKLKILEKIKTRPAIKKVKIFDEEVNVALFSIEQMNEYDYTADNKTICKFLAEQFTDIETGEKIFTPGFIEKKLVQPEVMGLVATFLKAQGVNKDFDKEFEKN